MLETSSTHSSVTAASGEGNDAPDDAPDDAPVKGSLSQDNISEYNEKDLEHQVETEHDVHGMSGARLALFLFGYVLPSKDLVPR